MRIKKNSKWKGLKPEILLAVMIAQSVYDKYELILTEGTGGSHMEGSLHYQGLAVDIRTRHIPIDELQAIVDDIRDRLTDDFDIVLHDTHLHIEFDVK